MPDNYFRKMVDDVFNDPKFKYKMSNIDVFTGVITDVNQKTNVAVVKTGDNVYENCVLPSPQVNQFIDSYGNSRIYGQFNNYKNDAFVVGIHFKTNQRNVILASFPTFTQDQYQLFIENNKKGIDRLPVKDADKRDFDPDTQTDLVDSEIIKWGEHLLYSSGLAAILMDYAGNILSETEKEFHVRVGDRDTLGKISAPEMHCTMGRIVDSVGDPKVDADDKKIKAEFELTDKLIITINEDGKVKLDLIDKTELSIDADGNVSIKNDNTEMQVNVDGTINLGEASLESMVLGDSLKTYIDNTIVATFNSHLHNYIMPLMPLATGPTLGPLTPMTSGSYLSQKNKTK